MKGREGMISIEHTKYSTYPIFGWDGRFFIWLQLSVIGWRIFDKSRSRRE
jgi:hypothetical protein